MEVKVVITLAPDVRNIMEGLVGVLSRQSVQIDLPSTIEEKKEKTEQTKEVKPSKKETSQPEQKKEKKPSITIEEIRALASKAIKKDRDKVKKILTSFGATSVSALEEEHYDDFYKKIGELI